MKNCHSNSGVSGWIKILSIATILGTIFFPAFSLQAATKGLPFTEDFTDASLKDSTKTNAAWLTPKEEVVQKWQTQTQSVYNGFANKPDFGASGITYVVKTGDFNNDGKLDIVTGETTTTTSGRTNKIFLGNGDGTFNHATDIAADTDITTGMTVGDLNRDGNLDIVTSNYGATDKVYLGNGNGTFASAIEIDPSATYDSAKVKLGDLNNDGNLDVVIAVLGSPPSQVYLGRGDGTFSLNNTGLGISSGTLDSMDIAIGDIDGDGDLDIAEANLANNNLIYLNPGHGKFNLVTAGTLTSSPSSSNNNATVAFADLDADGDLDIVVSCVGDPNYLFIGDGNGGFAAAVAIDSDSDNSRATLLQDFDNDGDIDLICANDGQENKVYLNDGSGSFTSTGVNVSSATNNSYNLATGDLDQDGDLDLLFANATHNKVYLNLANKKFSQTATAVSSDSDTTYDIAVGDVDNDGDLDIVVANYGDQDQCYLQNIDGSFTSNPIDSMARADSSVIMLRDVDGDGNLDIVIGNYGTANKVYLGHGDGNFGGTLGAGVDIESGETDNTVSMSMGDIDSDGIIDLVTGNSGAHDKFYAGNGDGTFKAGIVISNDTADTFYIKLDDFDNDGNLDIVRGKALAANTLYLGDGAGNFTLSDSFGDASNLTYHLAIGDIDGDGDPDVIEGNLGQEDKIYINNGDGTFASATIVAASSTYVTTCLDLGDIDGDGNLDLFCGIDDTTSQENVYYPGSGDGTFAAERTFGSEMEKTKVVKMVDIDGDGDLDIVVGDNCSTTTTPSGKIYFGNRCGLFNGAGRTLGTETDKETLALALGDIDNDGNLDIVCGNNGQRNLTYLGNGDGTFATTGINIDTDMSGTWDLKLGDFDNNGTLDVVCGNRGLKTSKTYSGNGDGTFTAGVEVDSYTYATAAVAVGDLNGDGWLDIILGNVFEVNKLYLNDGSGGFNSAVDIGSGESDFTEDLALGDLNNDGNLDVVVSNNGETNKVYLGDGTGAFAAAIDVDTATYNTKAIALGDLNGDGKLDLVCANYSFTQPNKVYIGQGNGTFNAAQNIGLDKEQSRGIALGDIDHDGDLDVVVSNLQKTKKVYYNSGSGTFSAHGQALGDEEEYSCPVVLGDLDHDGDLDAVFGNGQSQSSRIYLAGGYWNGNGQVVSQEVDNTASDIPEIKLTVDATTPLQTSIDWYLSNNGGGKWYQVQPDSEFIIPTVGSDLRWKAILNSLSPALTPVINEVRLNQVLPEFSLLSSTPGTSNATLNVTVAPHNLATSAWFEWGLTSAYGTSTTTSSIPATTTTATNTTLSGLETNTVYHWRAVASSDAGTTSGDDQIFLTGGGTAGSSHLPAKIAGGSEYATVQLACDAGSDSDTVQLWAATITGDLDFAVGDGNTVTLEGGWDCDYSGRSSTTSTLSGTVTITSGALLVDGVQIK